MLKHTPFHEFHVTLGARMVDFAGWEMPIVYRGIVEEHEQTRKSGSLFDVSHMGRTTLTGHDGGEVPSVSRGIVEEHEQTRKSGSLFDVSHMGRLHFTGHDAAKFLDMVLTRN